MFYQKYIYKELGNIFFNYRINVIIVFLYKFKYQRLKLKKKILITGSGGFIGSHLTEMLIEHGFAVKAFDRYNSNNESFKIMYIE